MVKATWGARLLFRCGECCVLDRYQLGPRLCCLWISNPLRAAPRTKVLRVLASLARRCGLISVSAALMDVLGVAAKASVNHQPLSALQRGERPVVHGCTFTLSVTRWPFLLTYCLEPVYSEHELQSTHLPVLTSWLGASGVQTQNLLWVKQTSLHCGWSVSWSQHRLRKGRRHQAIRRRGNNDLCSGGMRERRSNIWRLRCDRSIVYSLCGREGGCVCVVQTFRYEVCIGVFSCVAFARENMPSWCLQGQWGCSQVSEKHSRPGFQSCCEAAPFAHWERKKKEKEKRKRKSTSWDL